MAFEDLNDDVLGLIISHLYATPPPPTSLTWDPPVLGRRAQGTAYALVNKRWQALAERHTLASIALKTADLPTFATTFASPRRREFLRRLSLTVSLPTHGESRDSFARNLAAFRATVSLFFGTLSLWSGRQQGRLELHLDAAWDIEYQDNEPVDLYFDVTKSSASRRYLTLLDDDGQQLLLPPVQSITSFITSNAAGRAFHPTALCTLAAAMPRLTLFSLSYLDPVPARIGLRRELRCALASGLLSLSPLAALSQLTVIREPMSSIHNHSFSVGTLQDSDGVDAFSAAVDKILAGRHGLTDLHLEDTLLSAQLFLGHGPWPTLRRLRLRSAEILAPSGAWYYTGDPAAVEAGVDSAPASPSVAGSRDEDSSESDDGEDDDTLNGVRPTHEWRMQPDPLTFDPLIAALTDAVVSRMPVLESVSLELGMQDQSECIGVEVRFVEAGVRMESRPDWQEDSEDEIMARRCYCWVGRAAEWEAPEKVLAMWHGWVGERGRVEMGRWPPMS